VSSGLFGWGWHESEEAAWAACPRFSTDPTADYYVFTVAYGWPRGRKASFLVMLSELITQRSGPLSSWAAGLEFYRVGDYSFAALATLEEEKALAPDPARIPAPRKRRASARR
jgi:hypothetical protein